MSNTIHINVNSGNPNHPVSASSSSSNPNPRGIVPPQPNLPINQTIHLTRTVNPDIFKKVIDSAAVASAKILSKQQNLAEQIESKKSSRNNKTFPNHIIGKVKHLDEPIRSQTAIQLLDKEIETVTEHLECLALDNVNCEQRLLKIIETAIKLDPDHDQLNIDPTVTGAAIISAFKNKRLEVITTFTSNRMKQEEERQKKAALAKAARDKQTTRMQTDTPELRSIVSDLVNKNFKKLSVSNKSTKTGKPNQRKKSTSKSNPPSTPSSNKTNTSEQSKSKSKSKSKTKPKNKGKQDKGKGRANS